MRRQIPVYHFGNGNFSTGTFRDLCTGADIESIIFRMVNSSFVYCPV
jgi:hypothetical protein